MMQLSRTIVPLESGMQFLFPGRKSKGCPDDTCCECPQRTGGGHARRDSGYQKVVGRRTRQAVAYYESW